MTHIRQLAEGATELDRVWNLRPQFYAVFMDDYNRSIARVEPTLIELCRLRMAILLASDLDRSLRYRAAVAAGLSEAKLAELGCYTSSPLFSERERICIDFAERFVIQSSTITDEDTDRVQTMLTPEEFVYFVKALSVIDQFQRACVAFDVRPGDTVPPKMSGAFQPAPRPN